MVVEPTRPLVEAVDASTRVGIARLRASCVICLAIIAGFIAAGWLTLPDYGITWDEAGGDMFFGDRYYEFIKSGFNEKYLDFDRRSISYYRRSDQVDFFASVFRQLPQYYYPVSNTIVAAFGDLLDRQWGVMDPIDARHAGIVVLAALTLVGVWTLSHELFGTRAAVLATLLLATHPRFWGHAHNNIKDIGVCAFYTWSLIAFYRGVSRPSISWLLTTALSLGLAMGSKLNAIFIPVTVAPWLVVLTVARRGERRPLSRVHLVFIGVIPLLAGITYFASWPWLWTDTVDRLALHLRVFADAAIRTTDQGWQWYPLWQTTIATPLPMLILCGVGLLGFLTRPAFRRQWRGSSLLLAWLAVPLLRSMPPSIVNFDGIRHFLEFLPAMAIIAGAGGRWLWDIIARRRIPGSRLVAGAFVLALATLPAIWTNIETHPYETASFNSLGQHNLLRRWSFTRDLLCCYRVTCRDEAPNDYWANSYRAGLRWLSEHAEPNAILQVPIAPQTVAISGKIWLRPDLRVELFRREAARRGTPPRYVMLLHRPGWVQRFEEFVDQHTLLRHSIQLYGHTILSIHKFATAPNSPSRDLPR